MFIFFMINIISYYIMNSIIIFIMFLCFDYSVVRITTLSNSTISINNLYATDIPIIIMISNSIMSIHLTMY